MPGITDVMPGIFMHSNDQQPQPQPLFAAPQPSSQSRLSASRIRTIMNSSQVQSPPQNRLRRHIVFTSLIRYVGNIPSEGYGTGSAAAATIVVPGTTAVIIIAQEKKNDDKQEPAAAVRAAKEVSHTHLVVASFLSLHPILCNLPLLCYTVLRSFCMAGKPAAYTIRYYGLTRARRPDGYT